MRKFLKNNILEIFQTMYEAHSSIKKLIDSRDFDSVNIILEDCQNAAVQIGTSIESSEGEGFVTVKLLEEYCEAVFEVSQSLSDGYTGNKAQKALDKKLIKAENSAKNDLKVKLEIVFMPYKASMWDSLESVWIAADQDPDCDAYVVPIPYYDRNPDHSFGQFHYEGGDMPEYVTVTHYEMYDLSKRLPDVIYIHNPYDANNFVTSVDPRFYSEELKKYTECLVYIPYYATAGGMSEGQKYASGYINADYIITQADKYRDFFDPTLPDKKFLAMGSPKFDRVINMCKNPPEPPAEWKAKMEGRKVYFYNTSIGGMLGNTEAFMKKMQYVFETFANTPEACLLWRPHPLLESTIDSMRPQFKRFFNALKDFFIENDIGIYDNTPDITPTIALSDAYIGDSGTSVTSLFGVAGKPMFIFNNSINTEPTDSDKIAENIVSFNNEWLITPKNTVYHSAEKNYIYKYFCRLSDYSGGNYYTVPYRINDRLYVFPLNAQDILILNENGIEKHIYLEKGTERAGAFVCCRICGRYVFLIPNQYPAIVRFDTKNNSVKYLTENLDVFIAMKDGQRCVGGSWQMNGNVYIASPVDNRVLIINAETCEEKVVTLKTDNFGGCVAMNEIEGRLWFVPRFGKTVVSWDPVTNDIKEYSEWTDDFKAYHPAYNCEYDENPFVLPAVHGDYIYLPPSWGNMFIRINTTTGKAEKWDSPFDMPNDVVNGYYGKGARCLYMYTSDIVPTNDTIYSAYEKKLYKVDYDKNTYTEIPLELDLNELEKDENGFAVYSNWLQYCCMENAFNSLSDFIKGNITGNSFDKEKQLETYRAISANFDGSCGENVHKFMCSKLK